MPSLKGQAMGVGEKMKRGPKPKEIKSTVYRFAMPGQIDEALIKRADGLKIKKVKLLQKIVADYLGVEYY